MTTLCLTGWQQPADALSVIVPDAQHFDYAAYDNVEAMFAALPKEPSVAIGWSLGGQLLARAIAGGHMKPKLLVLLGAPFQWVADARFPEGIPPERVGDIRDNYARAPEAMLKNLNTLIALGDIQGKAIVRTLNDALELWPNGRFWFEELACGSCAPLDFSGFPPAIVLHGLEDKVIRFANAQALTAKLPQAELLLWPRCAHAPHLHDAQAVREFMDEHV